MEMLGKQVVLVLSVLHALQASTVSELTRHTRFRRCSAGQISNGQQLDNVTGRSVLGCAARCSRLTGCVGINVCPAGLSSRVTCTLIGQHSSAGCDDLSNAVVSACFFVRKHSTELETTTTLETTTAADVQTTEPECQNGGTLVGGDCQCTPQYSGTKCERLIRDCSEVYENGHQSGSYNGVYDIRPIGAPVSFKVVCSFEWGFGITYALRRKTFVYNPTWIGAKRHAGDDLSTNPSSKNFFIGLENLRRLVTQANYTNLVFMKTSTGSYGWANYKNFSLGPDTSDYVMTYDEFTFHTSYPADNGFPVTNLPVTFNTFDHGSCYYAKSSTSGWYGTDCSGSYSVFANDLKWPIGGAPTSLSQIDFDIVRDSPFYE